MNQKSLRFSVSTFPASPIKRVLFISAPKSFPLTSVSYGKYHRTAAKLFLITHKKVWIWNETIDMVALHYSYKFIEMHKGRTV